MDKIKFSKEERAALVGKVQDYFLNELDSSIGEIPAELLLDFLQEEIGAYYYSKGLSDAQSAFRQLIDTFDDSIYALEQREARVR